MSIENNKATLVCDVMLSLEKTSVIGERIILKEALEEMSKSKLGIACIVDKDTKLLGVLTDGDIRRKLLKVQKPFSAFFVDDALDHAISSPVTIQPNNALIDAVQLMGETTESLKEMRASDLVVQPSRFESFGLTALESISVGTPVLVSNVGGLNEIVQDMVTGKVFNAGSSQSLAENLEWAMQNEAEMSKLSIEAYRLSKERFNQEKMLSELSQIYSI